MMQGEPGKTMEEEPECRMGEEPGQKKDEGLA